MPHNLANENVFTGYFKTSTDFCGFSSVPLLIQIA